jgi:L-fuculose-phosphate aldolase
MNSRPRADILRSLIAAGRRLDDLGLVPARDGNLSARVSDRTLLVTVTGVRKRDLDPDAFVEVDLQGNPIRAARPGGSLGRASTELGLHLAVYRRRPDVEAVVHAHPPVAVGFATAGLGLTECLMPEAAVHLGSVPLTPYATPGTPELEAAVTDTVPGHDAFLLANHGAVTVGASVDQALERMETLEHLARIALVARLLGGAQPLTAEAVEDIAVLRARSGNPRPVTCTPAGAPPSPASLLGCPETRIVDVVARVVRDVLAQPRQDRNRS